MSRGRAQSSVPLWFHPLWFQPENVWIKAKLWGQIGSVVAGGPGEEERMEHRRAEGASWVVEIGRVFPVMVVTRRASRLQPSELCFTGCKFYLNKPNLRKVDDLRIYPRSIRHTQAHTFMRTPELTFSGLGILEVCSTLSENT